jgi:hypothetical protein
MYDTLHVAQYELTVYVVCSDMAPVAVNNILHITLPVCGPHVNTAKVLFGGKPTVFNCAITVPTAIVALYINAELIVTTRPDCCTLVQAASPLIVLIYVIEPLTSPAAIVQVKLLPETVASNVYLSAGLACSVTSILKLFPFIYKSHHAQQELVLPIAV